MKDKETFYFSHDYNSREDEKVKELVFQYGMTGYGIYWALVEMLYQNANALRTNYARIAFDLHQSTHTNVQAIIEDFDLFSFNEDRSFFYSNSIQRRLEKRDEKSKKARESALNRWGKSESNANASKTQSELDAIKESKGKENKVKDNFLLEKETKEILSDFEEDIDDHLKIPTSVNTETKEAKKVAPKKVTEILHIPEDFISLWNDWTEYRKLRKFKPYAGLKYEQMAVDKLLELSGCDPIIASKILQNTFTNNYQGFFPLKENQNGNSNTGQSNSNGNGHSAGSNQFGKGGKITASQMVARARQEATARHSESGNRTSNAEILT